MNHLDENFQYFLSVVGVGEKDSCVSFAAIVTLGTDGPHLFMERPIVSDCNKYLRKFFNQSQGV